MVWEAGLPTCEFHRKFSFFKVRCSCKCIPRWKKYMFYFSHSFGCACNKQYPNKTWILTELRLLRASLELYSIFICFAGECKQTCTAWRNFHFPRIQAALPWQRKAPVMPRVIITPILQTRGPVEYTKTLSHWRLWKMRPNSSLLGTQCQGLDWGVKSPQTISECGMGWNTAYIASSSLTKGS